MCAKWPTNLSMSSVAVENLWRVASVLHANGQTTQRLIKDTARLANAWALDWQIWPQWDGIVCRWRSSTDDDTAWHSAILPTRPAGVDMHKVASTNRLIDQACQDERRLEPERIQAFGQAMVQIEQFNPSSHARFVIMAGLGAAALGLIFGVSDALVLGLIFITAALGAAARRMLARFTTNLLLQPFVAALIAGLAGGLAQQLITDTHLQFIEIAACMILVPGAHILNAALDLMRGRLGLGIARMAYCLLILLAICVGLLLGLALADGALSAAPVIAQTPLWLDILAAGTAVAAFGAFFSLPWALLVAPVMVGMICHGSRWLVLESGSGVVTATLVASLIAGSVMTVLARTLKLPFAALAFASVVSMMPGIFVFKFAASLVAIYNAGSQATLTMLLAAVSNGTAALMVVLAMTLGLIVPKIMIESIVFKDN
jgi:uncharacterized membrane protein YjjP (DUF1212 family)